MSKPAFYGALSAQEVFFYPDMALDALPERLHIDLPLDGKPGVQLLLRTGGEAIRLTLEGGGFAAEYYAMRAVPVEYNTGDGTQQGGAVVLEAAGRREGYRAAPGAEAGLRLAAGAVLGL
ncbi:putative uncharacterized protein [Firmicutes bacterium CAG:170]|nr:putative uncharacterized protein [Firmicutes bacterium CAG:170]